LNDKDQVYNNYITLGLEHTKDFLQNNTMYFLQNHTLENIRDYVAGSTTAIFEVLDGDNRFARLFFSGIHLTSGNFYNFTYANMDRPKGGNQHSNVIGSFPPENRPR
jgi:hypothetical protein